MADITIKDVPARVAKKFAHAREISYEDFVASMDIDTDTFSIRFNPAIDAKQLLAELQAYDG